MQCFKCITCQCTVYFVVWLWSNIHNDHVFHSVSSYCWKSFFTLIDHSEVSFKNMIRIDVRVVRWTSLAKVCPGCIRGDYRDSMVTWNLTAVMTHDCRWSGNTVTATALIFGLWRSQRHNPISVISPDDETYWVWLIGAEWQGPNVKLPFFPSPHSHCSRQSLHKCGCKLNLKPNKSPVFLPPLAIAR
jgi:hypothetical protein